MHSMHSLSASLHAHEIEPLMTIRCCQMYCDFVRQLRPSANVEIIRPISDIIFQASPFSCYDNIVWIYYQNEF